MLHELAKHTGRWLIGGSIPERDEAGKLYNTSCGGAFFVTDKIPLEMFSAKAAWLLVTWLRTVWNPQGEMVAKYRKMHLFDIDIPGEGLASGWTESSTASQAFHSTFVLQAGSPSKSPRR